jgi:hypothetical protein
MPAVTSSEEMRGQEGCQHDNSEVLLLDRLPNAFFIEFITLWLDLEGMCVLDSALTNKRRRPYFLSCLKEAIFIEGSSRDVRYIHFSRPCLQWIQTRQMSIPSLSCLQTPITSGFEFGSQTHLDVTDADLLLLPPSLKSLRLRCCGFVTATGVSLALRTLPSLTSLNLSFTEVGKSDTVHDAIAAACPNLVALNLRHSKERHSENDNAMIRLIQSCGCLTSIDLRGFDLKPETVEHLVVVRGRQLRHLRLEFNNITGKLLDFITLHCDGLVSLHLEEVRVTGPLPGHVFERLPRLQSLGLVYRTLNRLDLSVLPTYLKELHSLKISIAGHTDGQVLTMLRAFPVDQMISIELWDANAMGDDPIIEIGRRFRSLLHFGLVDCFTVTDLGITEICKNGKLTSLYISSNEHISEAAISRLVDTASELEAIRIVHVPKVGKSGVERVITSCKKLKQIFMPPFVCEDGDPSLISRLKKGQVIDPYLNWF